MSSKMGDSIKQLRKVERALAKVKKIRNRDVNEYEDDVWNFFQDCWHLKDWIKKDRDLSASQQNSVEANVAKIQELMICADLANRSKHYTLDRHRGLDADVSKRNLDIFAANRGGYGERKFKISTDDGREFNVIDLAEAAVDQWRKLLKYYGLL